MKPVLVTQRVDIYPDRNERRDALDQRFAEFLLACGFLPIPVPNNCELAPPLFAAARPVGVVLSGGNDLAVLGGNAPERDATEAALVELAGAQRVPVIGVCRGMQFLVQRAGGQLARVENHVAQRHAVSGAVNRTVNSFHSWGVRDCGANWESLATADDGSIEFARCAARRQWGLMWHPEREREFCAADVELFREMLRESAA